MSIRVIEPGLFDLTLPKPDNGPQWRVCVQVDSCEPLIFGVLDADIYYPHAGRWVSALSVVELDAQIEQHDALITAAATAHVRQYGREIGR